MPPAPVLPAPCTQALENLSLAERAARENDNAGISALLADGKIYELGNGTRFGVSDYHDINGGTIVEVYVESGVLIGKTVCLDKQTLSAKFNPTK